MERNPLKFDEQNFLTDAMQHFDLMLKRLAEPIIRMEYYKGRLSNLSMTWVSTSMQ